MKNYNVFSKATQTDKQGKDFCIIEYKGLKDKKHWYTIRYDETGNEYLADWGQLKRNTCKDLEAIRLQNRIEKQQKLKDRARKGGHGHTQEYKKFDFKDKIVLGLDLSTNFTGYCLVRDKEILSYGGIGFRQNMTKAEYEEAAKYAEIFVVLEKKLNFRDRIQAITELLISSIHIADIILIEDTQFQSNAKTFAQLCEMRGFIIAVITEYNQEFEVISAAQWRKAHGFEGHKRDELKSEAIRKFERVIGRRFPFDDVAEAYFIATAGKKLLQI
jgi:Holliday junction resolvasome RuvABC endonuclease subunit